MRPSEHKLSEPPSSHVHNILTPQPNERKVGRELDEAYSFKMSTSLEGVQKVEEKASKLTIICACPGCDQPGTKMCGACGGRDSYCSSDCQKVDWKVHRLFCGKILPVGELPPKEAVTYFKRSAIQKMANAAMDGDRIQLRRLDALIAFAEKHFGKPETKHEYENTRSLGAMYQSGQIVHHLLYEREKDQKQYDPAIIYAEKGRVLMSAFEPSNEEEAEYRLHHLGIIYKFLADLVKDAVKGCEYGRMAIATFREVILAVPLPPFSPISFLLSLVTCIFSFSYSILPLLPHVCPTVSCSDEYLSVRDTSRGSHSSQRWTDESGP